MTTSVGLLSSATTVVDDESMSMILATTSGSIKVIPHRHLDQWTIFSSALEATSIPEVFPLPLDDEEFDRWWLLVTLVDSRAILDPGYFLNPRQVLYRRDYKRILALMDPAGSFWKLYCLPERSFEECKEIGRVLIEELSLIDDEQSSIFYLTMDSMREIAHSAAGLIHYDSMIHGHYINDYGRRGIRIDHVSWQILIEYLSISNSLPKSVMLWPMIFSGQYDYVLEEDMVSTMISGMIYNSILAGRYSSRELYPHVVRYLLYHLKKDNRSHLRIKVVSALALADSNDPMTTIMKDIFQSSCNDDLLSLIGEEGVKDTRELIRASSSILSLLFQS